MLFDFLGTVLNHVQQRQQFRLHVLIGGVGGQGEQLFALLQELNRDIGKVADVAQWIEQPVDQPLGELAD